jgi:hypothetical protein
MIEILIECPLCKAPESCITENINETKKVHACFNCGYQTSDLMVEGEFDFEAFEDTMPELHKAAKIKDALGRVWYPRTINIQDKGAVFLNGTSEVNSYFSAIKTIPLTKEEKKMPRFKGQTHKSDPSTLQNFGLDGFFEACDYIGLFDLETQE